MPEIEVEIELYCETCGKGICGNGTATKMRHQPCFMIEACETCVEQADAEGYKRGYDEGYREAKAKYT